MGKVIDCKLYRHFHPNGVEVDLTSRIRIIQRLKDEYFLERLIWNKPGTAQVGAISKAQKDSKTTFSTTGDNKSSQKTKN